MIALFVHELAASGVARNAVLLASHLKSAGHDVVLVTALPAAGPAGIEHVALLRSPLPWRLLEKLAAAVLMFAWLLRTRPALLLSMGNHGHATAILATACLPKRPLRVLRISNDLARTQARAGRANLAQRARNLGAALLVRNADAVVAVAPMLLDHTSFAKLRRSGRLRVIENGVDGERARALARKPPPHPWLGEPGKVILAVGRLSPQKNFFRLIDATAALQAAVPSRLIIVGSSRDTMRQRLLDHAVRRGIADRVALVGAVGDIFPWYAHADCFVLPSLWEGAANVLLEAMAVGVPVASSITAGNAAAVLDHGRCGLLFDPEDIRGMARAIGTQLDRATALPPGNRADDYDLSRTMAQWQSLLDELRHAAPPRLFQPRCAGS